MKKPETIFLKLPALDEAAQAARDKLDKDSPGWDSFMLTGQSKSGAFDPIEDVRSAVDHILASTGFKPTKIIYTEEQERILLEHGRNQGKTIVFSEQTKKDLAEKLGVTALLEGVDQRSRVVEPHMQKITGLLLIDDHLKPDGYLDPDARVKMNERFRKVFSSRIAKDTMGVYDIKLESDFRTPKQQEILEKAAGKTYHHCNRKKDA